MSLSEKGVERIKAIHLHEGGIHQKSQSVVESLNEKQYEELLGTHHQITNLLEAPEKGGFEDKNEKHNADRYIERSNNFSVNCFLL